MRNYHTVLARKTTIQHKVHISSLHLFCCMLQCEGSGFWWWRRWRWWYIFVIRPHLCCIETAYKPVGTRRNRPIRNPSWGVDRGNRHIFSETRIFLSEDAAAALERVASSVTMVVALMQHTFRSKPVGLSPSRWMTMAAWWVVSGFCGSGDAFPVWTDWGDITAHTHTARRINFYSPSILALLVCIDYRQDTTARRRMTDQCRIYCSEMNFVAFQNRRRVVPMAHWSEKSD